MNYPYLYIYSQLKHELFLNLIYKEYKPKDGVLELSAQYDQIPRLLIKKRVNCLRKLFNDRKCNTNIMGKFTCLNGSNIHFGANDIISYWGVFLDEEQIELGNNVLIGPNCRLLASSKFLPDSISEQDIEKMELITKNLQVQEIKAYKQGDKNNKSERDLEFYFNTYLNMSSEQALKASAQSSNTENKSTKANICIKDSVWIGANTTIAAGVTIGKNTIVGTHSLVLNDLPDNVIAFGRPCKIYRQITEADQQSYGHPFAGEELEKFIQENEIKQIQSDRIIKYQGLPLDNGSIGMNHLIFTPLPDSFIPTTASYYEDLYKVQDNIQDKNQQYEQRAQVLAKYIGSCGTNLKYEADTLIVLFNNIHIGDQVELGKNLVLLSEDQIKIGNNVKIGEETFLITGIHPLDSIRRNTTLEFCGPITIEDNVVIGDRVVITPNVTIGKNSIIASNSIVKKSVAPNSYVGGIPATNIYIKE